MSVSGVGGAQGGFDVGDAASAAQSEGVLANDAIGAVRGAGTTVPREVGGAVTAFDQQHHANRNIPDLSYGPTVVSGTRNSDGSWNVTVGSSPTSIAGPRPGQKPFDLVTYLWKNGKVSVEKNPPATSSGDAIAGNVEAALKKGDGKTAVSDAIGAGKALVGPGLGFPRLVDKPAAADVQTFKDMLSKLEKDGKLDDLKKASDAEEKRERDAISGGRPGNFPIPDWYGSGDVMNALVDKYGSASQKATWRKS
jgi:hypothetical protein